ncbi:hypothetical protein BT96DRAFT_997585 [Gymnopus androsaceus JB14]|uniref:Uncharacterized protein n=1 Tax=Gymnopus androsaceus JB14 TaxID=1447944 RepID=A0A6A4HCW8_9AGAR|nr:hypothetical protein BT96DRAFT_997585 [Gymnopus androsaceus JB14]
MVKNVYIPCRLRIFITFRTYGIAPDGTRVNEVVPEHDPEGAEVPGTAVAVFRHIGGGRGRRVYQLNPATVIESLVKEMSISASASTQEEPPIKLLEQDDDTVHPLSGVVLYV